MGNTCFLTIRIILPVEWFVNCFNKNFKFSTRQRVFARLNGLLHFLIRLKSAIKITVPTLGSDGYFLITRGQPFAAEPFNIYIIHSRRKFVKAAFKSCPYLSKKALWTAATALSASSFSMRTEIVISLVEIMLMLIPAS